MEAIYIEDAPKAIGPYCHAMKVGNLLFCSGQTPLDPLNMELVGSNIEEQTKQVLNKYLGCVERSWINFKKHCQNHSIFKRHSRFPRHE